MGECFLFLSIQLTEKNKKSPQGTVKMAVQKPEMWHLVK